MTLELLRLLAFVLIMLSERLLLASCILSHSASLEAQDLIQVVLPGGLATYRRNSPLLSSKLGHVDVLTSYRILHDSFNFILVKVSEALL